MDDYRNLPTIKFCADLFPAHRCPSVIKFKIRLECASVNRSNVLLISKAYFPAKNELNVKSETEIAKLRMFWSKLCKSNRKFSKNSMHRHGTLRSFPAVISPIQYGICVNIHYESVYFKELYTQGARILLTYNIQSGAAVASTITIYTIILINSKVRNVWERSAGSV